MESEFSKRFQLKRGYESVGVPVDKTINPKQVHRGTPLSSTGHSVIHSPKGQRMSFPRPNLPAGAFSLSQKRSPFESREAPRLRVYQDSRLVTPVSERIGFQTPTLVSKPPPKHSFHRGSMSFGSPTPTPLGGLGPNLGSEYWRMAVAKRNRVREYSNWIRGYHASQA